ncbi:MAG TPA: beta-Ala-His dipeptidase [Spirochaetales bacterium]|nr:beta-Ala-His dipeptidase [Spirochaetales bacterium]HRY55099.1 beta-Ala-His dipeptidase [Spirochaetia bacterium]HRZ64652.1 beta-Ala-His dipeptidase [Spirochaetia bacterium]
MELKDLEPKGLWRHFFDICSIPHPSHHEAALAAALADRARSRGLEARIDGAGNLVIRAPASPGRERAPGIILQAHLDMVPQAASGSAHDFSRDPIRPRIDPKDPAWLVASGTTLGADNGIGVAMALALLEEEGLAHGPLELLLTTNEEDGMTGARGVEEGALSGSLLVNLDGEDDGELTIGCAGSIRAAAELERAAEAPPAGLAWLDTSVSGLLGGHSGVDIDKGRANASLALVRLIRRAASDATASPRLASIEGGSAANAIPREARTLLGLPESAVPSFRAAFEREASALAAELGAADPGLAAALAPRRCPAPAAALGPAESAGLLAILAALPDGLVAMEPDMPGLIRTSLNLGVLAGRAEAGSFRLSTLVMIRSSSDREKAELGARVEAVLAAAAGSGWRVAQSRPSEGPAWPPNLASPLLATARSAYRELFGADPKVSSTHGGLEPSLFRPRFPRWDMISLGPKLLYPHSPDERLEIASVGRSYRFLRALVERLAG